MDGVMLLQCLGIILARATDVSLGTLRIILVVQGRKFAAFAIGFIEMFIWISIIVHIITQLNSLAHILCYAFGFGLGNFIGIELEKRIALGEQVLRIFTRKQDLAPMLRERGRQVTQFVGDGLDGKIHLLYIKLQRKDCARCLDMARQIDPKLFYIIENITESSRITTEEIFGNEWWRFFLKK